MFVLSVSLIACKRKFYAYYVLLSFVYCQWHFNHTIFEGIITPFHFDYFIKKIADTTPPTLKIKKIQTITHATICISLRQFNRTILKELLPLFT